MKYRKKPVEVEAMQLQIAECWEPLAPDAVCRGVGSHQVALPSIQLFATYEKVEGEGG